MGADNSHLSARSQKTRRSWSKVNKSKVVQAGSSSPGPSISSDSDIPYIPYTINRPIGDSPELTSHNSSLQPSVTPSPQSSRKVPRPTSYGGSTTGHDIIVVKEGVPNENELETDCELLKLQNIPTFHPIMRGALNIPTVQDPEILSKLNCEPVFKLCYRYQEHLRECSEITSTEQNNIAGRIREIDFAVTTLTNLLTESQKKFIKYSEQLGKLQEISRQLIFCESRLTEVISSMDSLNTLLPPELQLEPFVMVTG